MFLASISLWSIYLIVPAIGLWYSLRQRRRLPAASRNAAIGFSFLISVLPLYLIVILLGLWLAQAGDMSSSQILSNSQIKGLDYFWNLGRNVLTVISLIFIGRAVFLDRTTHHRQAD